jgi:hypothetical protein
MIQQLKRFSIMVFLWLIFFFMVETDTSGDEPSGKGAPAGYASTIVQVKFREGTDVSAPEQLLPAELQASVASVTRLFSGLSKEKLDKMKDMGERRGGEKLPDLALWFKITLKPGSNAAEFVEKLKRLNSVETLQFSPLPLPPP